jgi:hypothetical protein
VARHDDACGVQPRRDRANVPACFDKQMAALSARLVGRSVVGACPPARCARAEPAPVSRETHVWALRVPGAAAGMLSDGWP